MRSTINLGLKKKKKKERKEEEKKKDNCLVVLHNVFWEGVGGRKLSVQRNLVEYKPTHDKKKKYEKPCLKVKKPQN